MAERQFVNVARYEAMLDVELGQSTLGAQVEAILRLAERADVNARAATARRDMVGRAGQRLAPRVTDQTGQPCGETFLQTRLQRVVARIDAVLHPLNVADCGVRARARSL